MRAHKESSLLYDEYSSDEVVDRYEYEEVRLDILGRTIWIPMGGFLGRGVVVVTKCNMLLS